MQITHTYTHESTHTHTQRTYQHVSHTRNVGWRSTCVLHDMYLMHHVHVSIAPKRARTTTTTSTRSPTKQKPQQKVTSHAITSFFAPVSERGGCRCATCSCAHANTTHPSCMHRTCRHVLCTHVGRVPRIPHVYVHITCSSCTHRNQLKLHRNQHQQQQQQHQQQ